MNEELVPHNVDAERAVLGAMLIDPDAFYKVTPLIDASDFYLSRHQWIYEAYAALSDRDISADMVTLPDELERAGRLTELGGAAYLTGLQNATPTALNAEKYAHIVERCAVYRRIIRSSTENIQEAMQDSESPLDVIDSVQERMMQATARKGDGTVLLAKEVAKEYTKNVIERRERGDELLGLATGFGKLDRMLSGLQKGRFYTLAGRPGMGKTGLALAIALSVAKSGGNVAVFSFEMSGDQLFNRWVAEESGVDSRRTFVGDLKDHEWTLWQHAVDSIANLGLFIDEGIGAPTIAYVRAKARAMHMRYGLSLVIIDYLQLMEGDGSKRSENREREVAQISRGSKGMAMELKLPVLACCQLNRGVEQRRDKHPMLSDLRESGTLEQDSDAVMFIYRDDYYNEFSEIPGVADIDLAKWRDGPTGRVPLHYQKETNTFTELAYLEERPLDGFHLEPGEQVL